MPLHNAPSVTYPLGRSRFLGGLLLLAWSLAAVLTSAWWQMAAYDDLRPWLGVAALVIAGTVMARGWLRSPVGQLSWDGEHWAWESAGYLGGGVLAPPQVVLDLQVAVLLRLDNPAGASWWLWAERRTSPPHWLDLRRAVYAQPRTEPHTDILSGTAASPDDPAKVQTCDQTSPTLPR